MKIRESGMPDRDMWQNFFDPHKILKTLGMNNQVLNVAEFGCGYGTFTIPAAKIVKGTIYAFDIEPEMIEITNEEAKNNHLHNVKTILRDFVTQGSGLLGKSVEYVMLFNILHHEHPWALLEEAHRILKKDGKLGIIHWNYDSTTPRGPSIDIRPKPEECIQWAKRSGFRDPVLHDLKPYHYGITLIR